MCRAGQPVAAAEMSVATDDVSYDASAHLAPARGELRPRALVAILQVKSLILPGLSCGLKGNQPC